MTPFDPETITARILAEELQRMLETSGVSVDFLAARVGVTPYSIGEWMRGQNLSQPLKILALIDSMGFDVVFRCRQKPRRTVRLT